MNTLCCPSHPALSFNLIWSLTLETRPLLKNSQFEKQSRSGRSRPFNELLLLMQTALAMNSELPNKVLVSPSPPVISYHSLPFRGQRWESGGCKEQYRRLI